MKRYLALVAIMLLCPAALMAHDSGLVYARLERESPGGKVMLQATVECLSNPLVADQAAAREALVTLFDLQSPSNASGKLGDRASVGQSLGNPTWSVQKEWTDTSVPVPVQSPEDDGEEHCWVTARWELELPKDKAVCLHINAGTKLGALLWEVHPSGQSPDGKTRWQILLPGDRSSRLNEPEEVLKPERVAQPVSARGFGWGWSLKGMGTLAAVMMLTVGVIKLRARGSLTWLRHNERSCNDVA